jgi:hypothetical protein
MMRCTCIINQFKYRLYWYGVLLVCIGIMKPTWLFLTLEFIFCSVFIGFLMFVLSRGNYKTFKSKRTALSIAGGLLIASAIMLGIGLASNIQWLDGLGYMVFFAGIELIIFDSEIRNRNLPNASPD